MTKRILMGFTIVGIVASVAAGPASAQGLDGLHAQRAEGGRWCMADHSHFGTGSGATKEAAMREAISSYSSFTAWEYGDNWGRWSIAAAKSVNCTGSAGSWSCNLEARPCRPIAGGNGARRARPKRG